MNCRIPFITSLLIVCFGFILQVQASTELSLPENVQFAQDDLLEIPLQFSSDKNIAGLNVKINTAEGNVRLLSATPSSIYNDYRLYKHEGNDNKMNLIMFHDQAKPFNDQSKPVLNLGVLVRKNAPAGTYPIELTLGAVTDENGDSISELTLTSGSITVAGVPDPTAPTIAVDPKNQTIRVGETAVFNIVANQSDSARLPINLTDNPPGAGTFEKKMEVAGNLMYEYTYTGTAENVGDNLISFIVEDSGDPKMMDSELVLVNVESDGEPPSSQTAKVVVYDNPSTATDLTGQTDFDTIDDVGLTIAWNIEKGNATGWDIYVREGMRGPKFLARVNDPEAALIEWKKDAQNIAPAFQNGPNINTAYTFRVIRLDEQLGPDDFYDQPGYVGINLEGGSQISLMQPDMPDLLNRQIAVFDDILGGNNLATKSINGSDGDSNDWRALQIAFGFDDDPSTVMDYQILVRENEQDQFTYLGHTNSGNIRYFWWTQDNAFDTAPDYRDGPQDGKTYQFRVVKIGFDGSRDGVSSGWIQYNTSDTDSSSNATKSHVFVHDNVISQTDLTGQTDFDTEGNAELVIGWDADATNATGWDIYVREGLRGPKFLARVKDGSATYLQWKKDSPEVSDAFKSGPNFNTVYTFRVIRLDDQLSKDDFFDQAGYVGLNVEGGTNIPLTQPDQPNLLHRQIAVYDDILGGNNLSMRQSTGEDIDSSDWHALQIAFGFDDDPSTVLDYQILVREQGGNFVYLGHTNSGNIRYFWWTEDNAFDTAPDYRGGPQDGKTYQFRVVKIGFDGSREGVNSGWINYTVSENLQ